MNGTSSEKLIVNNASVVAEGDGTKGAICDLQSLSTTGCQIVEPTGAEWKSANHAVCDKYGNVVTGKVVISQPYDLWIGGVRVSKANYRNLSVIDGVEGTVLYEPSSKRLYLNNATIQTRACAIDSKISGLEIYVVGTNTLNNINGGIILSSSATISGFGSLNITSNTVGIYVLQYSTLTIKDCTVSTKGEHGILGQAGNLSEKVVIDNAYVSAEGDGTKGSVCQLQSLLMTNCQIVEPNYAKWMAEAKAICDDRGSKVTKKVVIGKLYDLWISGVQVNSANCDDLSVTAGVRGGAKYNPATKQLSLMNATIRSTYARAIESKIPGLIIDAVGTNTIESKQYFGICLYSSATIRGDGFLNITSGNNAAIYLHDNVSLTIKDCTINAKGLSGIEGVVGTLSEKLIVDNATIMVQGDGTDPSILNLQSFSTTNCQIIEPAGAVWNSSKHAVCDASGNKITDKVVIGKPYDLWIAGLRVNSINCDDLCVASGVEGTVMYAPEQNALYLTNATISASSDIAIKSKISGLSIILTGTNNVYTRSASGISFYSSGTISGDGYLNISSESVGLYIAENVSATIKDCSINVKGRWGIVGSNGTSSESLTINNANVIADGNGNNGSICNLQSFSTIGGCQIVEPTDARWIDSKHAICDKYANVVKSKVVISKPYDLWIAGVQVTSVNCSDLSDIEDIKSGTVTYDPVQKVLYLKNAKIVTTSAAIESKISGLVINLEGNNTVNSIEDVGVSLYSATTSLSPITINGTGSLNVLSASVAIYIRRNVSLSINDCSVSANGVWGIAGTNGESSESLGVNNANVTARGNGIYGSICDLQSFSRVGCDFVEPVDAVWNSSKHAICDGDGNAIVGTVLIMSGATGITSAEVGHATNTPYIYTLDGKKVNKPIDSLDKGIYIINGKKVIKR